MDSLSARIFLVEHIQKEYECEPDKSRQRFPCLPLHKHFSVVLAFLCTMQKDNDEQVCCLAAFISGGRRLRCNAHLHHSTISMDFIFGGLHFLLALRPSDSLARSNPKLPPECMLCIWCFLAQCCAFTEFLFTYIL